MVVAGRASGFGYESPPNYPPAYAPVSPAAPARRSSARLMLVMFLLGLAGAAAAVALSRPKGYAAGHG